MKRLLSCAVLLMVISCSKDNLDKKEDITTKNVSELTSGVKTANLDSIARMNAGAFLASDLTAREIDSLAKLNIKRNNKSTQSSAVWGPEYTDWSGKIRLQIFYAEDGPAQQPSAIATVSPDFVLVGGGVQAYDWSGYGAFITESRPDDSFTSWYGQSKDHIYQDYHKIRVYAIGMKIDGVTPEFLRSKMKLFKKVSESANHPYTYLTIDYGYQLIGGGAKCNYNNYGQLLTESHPWESASPPTWYVKSKDHRRADPSTITAYAIGIEDISFPEVGYIQTTYSHAGSTLAYPYGYLTETTRIYEYGTAYQGGLTCYGGEANWVTYGRMITEMRPRIPLIVTFGTVGTNAHTWLDKGSTFAWVIDIRKRPY